MRVISGSRHSCQSATCASSTCSIQPNGCIEASSQQSQLDARRINEMHQGRARGFVSDASHTVRMTGKSKVDDIAGLERRVNDAVIAVCAQRIRIMDRQQSQGVPYSFERACWLPSFSFSFSGCWTSAVVNACNLQILQEKRIVIQPAAAPALAHIYARTTTLLAQHACAEVGRKANYSFQELPKQGQTADFPFLRTD